MLEVLSTPVLVELDDVLSELVEVVSVLDVDSLDVLDVLVLSLDSVLCELVDSLVLELEVNASELDELDVFVSSTVITPIPSPATSASEILTVKSRIIRFSFTSGAANNVDSASSFDKSLFSIVTELLILGSFGIFRQK